MKKTFLVAAVFAAMILGMTSCENKDTKRCWKVEIVGRLDGGEKEVGYLWKSQNELDAYVKEQEDFAKQYGGSVTITYSKATEYKTEADCKAADDEKGTIAI